MAVVIGHTVWNSAYATLIIQARTATLDPALEDAAADLGANPWRVFRRVTMPGLLPGIVAAGPARVHLLVRRHRHLVLPDRGGTATLPVVILSMIRFRITPEINAIGMMVMVFTVTMFAIGFLAVTRLGQRGPPGADAAGGAGVTAPAVSLAGVSKRFGELVAVRGSTSRSRQAASSR